MVPGLNPMRFLSLLLLLAITSVSSAGEIDFSGFALLRATEAGEPFADPRVSAQVQAGIDWQPRPAINVHVHLLARNAHGDNRRSSVGIPEAYLELNLKPKGDRLR